MKKLYFTINQAKGKQPGNVDLPAAEVTKTNCYCCHTFHGDSSTNTGGGGTHAELSTEKLCGINSNFKVSIPSNKAVSFPEFFQECLYMYKSTSLSMAIITSAIIFKH